jgi:translation initiation factor 1
MKDPRGGRARVVYSTDSSHKQACPDCGHDPCRCVGPDSTPPDRQAPRVRREVKGRGGKTVTVVYDLQMDSAALQALAKVLKQACATGGTVKEGVIELQGDHRDRVVARLLELGYRARAAGG